MVMKSFDQAPANLRAQMVERIAEMSDREVADLYELWLLKEKLEVRSKISNQAELEKTMGVWEKLPELVRAYRSRQKNV